MQEFHIDPERVLLRLERERNAYIREGQNLRALAERPVPAPRPKAMAMPLSGLIVRLRQALAAPARESEACNAGAAG